VGKLEGKNLIVVTNGLVAGAPNASRLSTLRGAQIEYCSGRLAAWMVLCVDSVEEIKAIKLTK